MENKETIKPPPLDAIPKRIHDEHRLEKLRKAIIDYASESLIINQDPLITIKFIKLWIDEYNKIIKDLK